MPSTRQLRLSDPAQIRNKIRGFLGKKINIVLADNTAMFGELMKVTDTEIQVKNMRLKIIHYPFNKIVEVYFDTLT